MTYFDEQRAYEFMRRLSFTRPGGTVEEARAAELIAAELRTAGLMPVLESFQVWTYEEEPSRVDVPAPGTGGRASGAGGRASRTEVKETIVAAPVGLSGVTDPDGVTGELIFVETGEEEFLHGIRGKIALTYELGAAKKYERLAKAEPKAVIAIGDPGRDLLHVSHYVNYFKRWGKLPTVFIRYEDGLRLIRSGAREVVVVCRQREIQAESRNVVVEIPGAGFGDRRPAGRPPAERSETGRPDDDYILLGGHYDSVPATAGAHDNAGGSAILVELARILAGRPPRRTVRIAWFGAEELGLHGSAAYVESQMKAGGRETASSKTALDRIKLVVNVDVAGGTIGRNHCVVTGPESLKNYVEVLGKEIGVGLTTKLGVMSSDGTPFADKGVPSVNFARYGGATANLHTPYDALEHTDAYHLAMLGRLVEVFVDRTANAMAYPFERDIPESVKKDIAKYREDSMGLEKEPSAEEKAKGEK